MPLTVEVEGLDKLQKAFAELPATVIALATRAMTLSVEAIEGRAAVYPAATAANRPGRVNSKGRPMGYYDRGVGWWYPVMNRSTLTAGLGGEKPAKSRGAIRAKRAQIAEGIAGYRLSKHGRSQRLRQRWATKITRSGNTIEGLIGNSASYQPYVIGDRQTRIMARIGWPTIGDAVDASKEDIDAAWKEALDELGKVWSSGS